MNFKRIEKHARKSRWSKAAIPIVIGVSAHRDIALEKQGEVKAQVGKFLDEIKALCPHSEIYMLTGLAKGGDLMCAKVAAAKGVKIVAALPFETFDDGTPYDNEADFGDELADYREMTASASVIKKFVVPDTEKIPDDPEAAAADPVRYRKNRRAYLFRQQAIYVSTNCHILLALWDGSPSTNSRLECGTNVAVEFALKHNFYHSRGNEFFSPYIGAVAGIFSPREGREYEASGNFPYAYITTVDRVNAKDRLERCAFAKVKSDDEITVSKKMPRHIREVLVRTDAYNADYLKYCKSLSHSKNRARENGQSCLAGEDIYNSLEEAKAVHDCCRVSTALSAENKTKYLNGVKYLSVFGVLLILAFMLYDQLSYFWTAVVCALMLLALVAGYVLVNFSEATRLMVKIRLKNSFDAHGKFIDYRALSETMRVQYYLLALGVEENAGNLFSWGHKSEMAWVKVAVTVLLIGVPESAWRGDTEREVIEKWIGKVEKQESGKTVVDKTGQLGYHLNNGARQRKKIKKRNIINGLVLVFTFATYIVLFACEIFGMFDPKQILFGAVTLRMLLKCCFSLFAAITFVVSYNYSKQSLDQNERDSIHMARLFRAALDRIENIKAVYSGREDLRVAEMESLVVELARNQLIENGTWVAYNRDNGNDVPI